MGVLRTLSARGVTRRGWVPFNPSRSPGCIYDDVPATAGHGINILAYSRDAGSGDLIMPTGQSAIWCKFLIASAKIVLASINLVPPGPVNSSRGNERLH